MPTGDVVIVTGPPGSGKTSTARLLAGRTQPLSVHLESDWFFRFIVSGFIAPHLPESKSQDTVVLDLTTDAAVGYARAGYTVFWDGIVGPWFLDRIAGRLATAGIRTQYVVLRPDRQTALGRVRERDGTTPWGRIVIAKAMLVAVVGALGVYNHFVLVPEMERANGDDGAGQESSAERFKKVVMAEALVLIAVIAATAFLVNAIPA